MRKTTEHIRDIREKNGWSRAEFAKIVNLSRQEIYLLDYNAVTPRMSTLRKIANALEIPLKELITE